MDCADKEVERLISYLLVDIVVEFIVRCESQQDAKTWP